MRVDLRRRLTGGVATATGAGSVACGTNANALGGGRVVGSGARAGAAVSNAATGVNETGK